VLSINARKGDFVLVNNKDNQHFGMIGRIKRINDDTVIVDIYGDSVEIDKKDLILSARRGTNKHDHLTEQIKSQKCAHLDEVGYDGLINLAIDMQDWEWAKELVDRKYKYLARAY